MITCNKYFFSFLYMYPKLAQVVLWLTWHILHVHGELKQLEQPQQTIWAVKRLQWGHVCYWSIPDPPWSRPIPGSSGPARSWWQLWFCALWLQGWNYICSTGKSSKLLRLLSLINAWNSVTNFTLIKKKKKGSFLQFLVFVGQDADEGVRLFWGIAADGSVVISDNLELIKASCAKSFAPFPAGMSSAIN